jgi:hypothetical protein
LDRHGTHTNPDKQRDTRRGKRSPTNDHTGPPNTPPTAPASCTQVNHLPVVPIEHENDQEIRCGE